MQARGSASKFVLGFEAAFNTDAAAGFVIPINSAGVVATVAQHNAATIRGDRNPDEPFDGFTEVAGPVVVPMDSVAMWYWLKAMFSDPVTTGTGPYVHTFKATGIYSQPPMTIEYQYTDISKFFKYNGCKVQSWSLEVGGDAELVNNLQLAGSKETVGAAAFDAAPTAVVISRLKNLQASLQEAGVAYAKATIINFNVDFGLDLDQHCIGDGGILGDIPEGDIKINGELETIFDSDATYQKAIASTKSALKITVTAGANSAIEIFFPEIKFGVHAPGLPGPQGIRCRLPWSAFYQNGSDQTAVMVTLTNSEAHA
jgi:hypothetical protein